VLGMHFISDHTEFHPDTNHVLEIIRKLDFSKRNTPPYMGIQYLKTKTIPVIMFYVESILAIEKYDTNFFKEVRKKIFHLLQQATCYLAWSNEDLRIIGIDVTYLIHTYAKLGLTVKPEVWKELSEDTSSPQTDPGETSIKQLDDHLSIYLQLNRGMTKYLTCMLWKKTIEDGQKNRKAVLVWRELIRKTGGYPATINNSVSTC
jgi:hypothetical protein